MKLVHWCDTVIEESTVETAKLISSVVQQAHRVTRLVSGGELFDEDSQV